MEGDSTSCRRLNFELSEDDSEENEGGLVFETDEERPIHVQGSNIGDNTVISHSVIPEESMPKLGIEFLTEEEAYEFYLKYAKQVGFGIRRCKKHTDQSGKLLDRVFCCSAQGKRGKDKRDIYVKQSRPETRFGCNAKIKISCRNTTKFSVVQFVKEHNHYLSSPNKTHLYRFHRNISSSAAIQIEMASDVEIPPKASHDLMARQVGGREYLGFIPNDYKNYLRSKRTRNMRVGDTGGVLEYLQKMQLDDPNFFNAIQVDEDDLITNIFWSDAKMRADYGNFGDVVSFDTTYRKNNEGRPIALFVGVNHHKQSIIFGAALLYDETALTFEWLFDTFVRAMSGKKPTTILTDQDAAMARALSSRWPETHHRLCIWHIYQNAAIHLSGVFSEFKEFAKDFASCIYDFDEEEEFISAWNMMLTKYTLEDNDWLRRLFHIKEKWALVYGRHMFCADMTTTQRSESMNSMVKRYVTYQHKFLDFFKHFQRLLDDRRYDELKADFKSNSSVPCLMYPIEILKHASRTYTPEAYKCFEQEWYKSHDSIAEMYENVGSHATYRVTSHKKKYHHIVTLDSSNEKIQCHCSCRKYEFAGILCAHILKIFTLNNIMNIPSEYILKRWTRKAKGGYFEVNDTLENKDSLDPKLLHNMRYRDLCGLSIQLVTKAAERDDTHLFVKDAMLSLCKMVDDKLLVNESNVQKSKVSQEVDQLVQSLDDSRQLNETEYPIGAQNNPAIKGIKPKKKTFSGKRLKRGLEHISKKKKVTSKTKQTSAVQGIEEHYESLSTMPNEEGQRMINKPTNHMQTLGSFVEDLRMVETQLSQATSSATEFQATISSSNNILSKEQGRYPPAGYHPSDTTCWMPPAGFFPPSGYPRVGYPTSGYPTAGYPFFRYPPAGHPPSGHSLFGYPGPSGSHHDTGGYQGHGMYSHGIGQGKFKHVKHYDKFKHGKFMGKQ